MSIKNGIKTIVKYTMIAALFTSLGYFQKDSINDTKNRFSQYQIKQQQSRYFLVNNKTKEELEIMVRGNKTAVGTLDYRLDCIEDEIAGAKEPEQGIEKIKSTARRCYARTLEGCVAEKGFAKNYLDCGVILAKNEHGNIETYITDGKTKQPLNENMQLGDVNYRLWGLVNGLFGNVSETWSKLLSAEAVKKFLEQTR